ncbi:MAG: 1-(5-phosphoribosyl)-5-[(5-phosphoribosylamino)methylideneamino]imidazole-4-carboxamide isomerase [Firmicutes bacterium]|jgi:phosphoribosylformimino-5-aminoimidazole carboxamide ribotide isomerase|nr:1-(5-phosphoribosyl)-5-[(5-phosphoribosylamino)methylideneamino]imidazole-4-carboxamide isomerase [Bacillota bacterium]
MIIFPAIDIRAGRCVRLLQGDYGLESVYGNPVHMAEKWAAAGAEYLHIVDLDGARVGGSQNLSVVQEILARVEIPVQMGGGIRSLPTLETVLETGVSRAILGSAAFKDPRFLEEAVERYPDQIAVSVDSRRGWLATDGWTRTTFQDALEFVHELEDLGVRTIIYTDIARDGMLAGPNLEDLQRINEAVEMNVIAAGGVSSIADLKALKDLGLYGAIIGKALYTGDIQLETAIKEVE